MNSSGRVHITSTSDVKQYKKIIFEMISTVEKEVAEERKKESIDVKEKCKEYELREKLVIQTIVKAFEPIAIEHCECIECDFEWTATVYSHHLLRLIYSEEDAKAISNKKFACPYCKFKPPIMMYTLLDFKKNIYLTPLVEALERLTRKRDNPGAIIFACISLEVFLAEVARYHMKQLETDSKIIEFFIDDVSPLISTYSKLFKKLKIGISKDLDKTRELSDMRNNIVHRNERSGTYMVSEIQKPFLKLAEFFQAHNHLHPRYCKSYDFWLDPATGGFFLSADEE